MSEFQFFNFATQSIWGWIRAKIQIGLRSQAASLMREIKESSSWVNQGQIRNEKPHSSLKRESFNIKNYEL